MSDPTQPTVDAHVAEHHDEDKADEAEPDVHFTPVVQLEKVEVKEGIEDEFTLFKMRAKLFRFDKQNTEWKERGTGEMRLLMHKITGKVRVLMRRDKTLKMCANHYITQEMKLNPNVGSDRAWVWTTLADASEDEVKPEMLAVRFANADIAQRFKSKFEESQKWNASLADGTATPNGDGVPQPDADAVEAAPEAGSQKAAEAAKTEEKKDDAAVAAVTAAVAASSIQESTPAPAPEAAAAPAPEAAPAERAAEEPVKEEPAASEPAAAAAPEAAAPAPAEEPKHEEPAKVEEAQPAPVPEATPAAPATEEASHEVPAPQAEPTPAASESTPAAEEKKADDPTA